MAQQHRVLFTRALVLCLALCLVLCYCAYKLRSYQSTEYDEGVYLTTFKSVQDGFPLYQSTFFSQPPGFFTTTFPLYSLLGSTLQAARLAVFFYSIIGLLAILWIGWEFGSVAFSFVAMGVLYLIPIYTVQIMTFHADSLPATFSTLAVASLLRFRNSKQRRWIGLSALFTALAVLIKVDVSTFPALFLILLAACYSFRAPKKIGRLLEAMAIFGIVFGLALIAFALPFGLNTVVSNVISLRVEAASASPQDPTLFWQFLQTSPLLIGLLIAGGMLTVIVALREKAARFPLLVLLAWVMATLAILLLYHPLMPHHLVLLAVPVTLLFSFALTQLLNSIPSPLRRLVPVAISLFLAVVLGQRVSSSLLPQNGIPTPLESEGIQLADTYTQPGDFIVSDDGIVTGLSNRPTPPDLTDISYVRLGTGSLNSREFKMYLKTYKPKLILAWADRLTYLQNFDMILQDDHYQLIDTIDSHYKAYLLESG